MKQILLFLILVIAGVGIAFAASNAIAINPQHLGVSNDAPLPCTPAIPAVPAGPSGSPAAIPAIPAKCPKVMTTFH